MLNDNDIGVMTFITTDILVLIVNIISDNCSFLLFLDVRWNVRVLGPIPLCSLVFDEAGFSV